MIDINAWTGHWNTLIVKGDVETVRRTVQAYGVEQIFMAPLDAAWCPDPHLYNEVVYKASDRYDDISPVPIIDPTLPTWQKELNRAAACTGVRLIKLLPGYGGYDLSKTDDFFTSVCEAKLGVMIQVRIDDPAPSASAGPGTRCAGVFYCRCRRTAPGCDDNNRRSKYINDTRLEGTVDHLTQSPRRHLPVRRAGCHQNTC